MCVSLLKTPRLIVHPNLVIVAKMFILIISWVTEIINIVETY